MRLLPMSWRWTRDTKPELRRPNSASSSDAPHDEPKSPQSHDPGLARLFSDAALFGKILTSDTDLPEGSLTADIQPVHDSLNGFSQLVAPDLDDHERAVSEKFAQISVSNWTTEGARALPLGVDPGESDESASDDEHDRIAPGDAVKEAGEPDFEAKLDPIEIVDLLEQEFGALASEGEERLLLESDATLFQDVVILVRFRLLSYPTLILTTEAGGGARNHTPPYVPRISFVISTKLSARCHKVWPRSCAPQRAVSEEEILAAVKPRHDQHLQFKSR